MLNIQYCYNTGEITSSKGSCLGSIVGYAKNINLHTCITSTSLKFRGGSAGGTNTNCSKDKGELVKGYADVLGSAYKNDDKNINNGYPILSWE